MLAVGVISVELLASSCQENWPAYGMNNCRKHRMRSAVGESAFLKAKSWQLEALP